MNINELRILGTISVSVAESFNQKHVVLTVGQALFPILMELKWVVPEHKYVLIPRIGGLHTSLNCFKIIGQHILDSGMPAFGAESGNSGSGTVEGVLASKDW